MKITLAHVTTRYRPALGGVEHYVEQLATRSVAAGHTVRIHATDLLTWGDGVAPRFVPPETPRHEAGPPELYRHRAHPLGRTIWAVSPPMAAALAREDADIFHAHYYGHFAADVAGMAARLKRRGLVINPYMAFDRLQSGLARVHAWGPGRLLRRADRIITISAAEERGLERLGFERARFVRVAPGIDCAEFDRQRPRPAVFPAQGPVLLFVGRVALAKGIDTLIEAMPAVRRNHPAATALVVGPEFGSGAHVRRLMRKHGVAEAVRIAGPVAREELLACYQHADLFVFPSRAEAFGIVVAEAMAAGLVPVAAAAMSLPEVVGNAGVLFPPGDAVALAREIGALLRDAPRRRELAAAGRQRVRKHFDWDQSAATLHSAYADVRRRPRPRTIVTFGFAHRAQTGGQRLYRELIEGTRAHGVALREISLESIPPAARTHATAAIGAALRLGRHGGALLFVDLAWNPRLIPLLPLARHLLRQRIAVGVCHRPSSGEPPGLRRRLLEISERWFLRHADHVYAISQATAREVADAGVPGERIFVLHPALPARLPRPYAPRAAGPLRLVTLGAVTPRKGLGDLVRAIATTDFTCELDVVGSLDDRAEVSRLRQQISLTGLGERVRLHGHLPGSAKEALLVAADLYVHPSHWEGFGYAVAEAMQLGLPVLATAVGALPELVTHRVTGILVPPAAPGALARAIRWFALHPQGAYAMGQRAAAEIARRRTPDEMAATFAKRIAQWAGHDEAGGETRVAPPRRQQLEAATPPERAA